MDQNFTHHKPLSAVKRPRTEDKYWDRVLDAYKEKHFADVVRNIIDYVDIDLAERSGNADRTEFEIPHGSITLKLKLTDDRLTVQAPFLEISRAKKIPLMRRVTELNFSPLNLARIHLEGDRLDFRYECPIALCEPYRTYEALREICIYADSYDDEFITKFGAAWIREPEITPYPEDARQDAWQYLHLYIQEARDGVSYFEMKRAFKLAWDVLTITLMKIEYVLRPQGVLRTDLEKTVSYLTSGNDPMQTKITRGKSFLEKLAALKRRDLERNLYTTQIFIPYKVRSSIQAVRNNSQTAHAQSKNEMESGNHLGASMTLLFHFYNLFYHNTVPEHVYRSVNKALLESGGQKWERTAEILFRCMDHIMKEDGSGGGDRGFFDKLFKRITG